MKRGMLKTRKRVSNSLITKISFMKKSLIIMSLAFALAIGSAFTVKVNPTGFKKVGSTVYSGPTNNANCAAQSTGSLCSILVEGDPATTVYSTQQGAIDQDSGLIMRY